MAAARSRVANAPVASPRFTLYPLRPGALYVNFGFWDVVTDRAPSDEYVKELQTFTRERLAQHDLHSHARAGVAPVIDPRFARNVQQREIGRAHV